MSDASTVARVRVENVSDALFASSGAEKSCGKIFRVVVLDSIKGARAQLSFWAPRSIADRMVRDGEYFAVIFERDIRAREAVLDFASSKLDEDELDRLKCTLDLASHFAEDFPVMVVPIELSDRGNDDGTLQIESLGFLPEELRTRKGWETEVRWTELREALRALANSQS